MLLEYNSKRLRSYGVNCAESSELLRAAGGKSRLSFVGMKEKRQEGVREQRSYCFSPPWTSCFAGCSGPGSGGSCRTGRRAETGSGVGNLQSGTGRGRGRTWSDGAHLCTAPSEMSLACLSRRPTATGCGRALRPCSAPSASHRSALLSGHSEHTGTRKRQRHLQERQNDKSMRMNVASTHRGLSEVHRGVTCLLPEPARTQRKWQQSLSNL